MSNLVLKLVHLYPQEMNIYGDLGNIICLKNRCAWRNIDLQIVNIGLGQKPETADIYFMGGGQDSDQFKVFDDLVENKKSILESEVNLSKVFLLICGGFQLFGKYFLDASGRQIPGLDILPIETRAPGDTLADRCLGNLATQITPELITEINKYYPASSQNTVGFENHSGQTFFTNEHIQPIGKVLHGKGNNAADKIEGARYKNVFGSYTHGSFLPKNPHIADLLLGLALRNKYGDDISLKQLDDDIEWSAHRAALQKL